jgi:polyhydroxyalkanoate synthesis regulator phasin
VTETEAKQFIDDLKKLCEKHQDMCDCNIELTLKEVYKRVPHMKFLVIEMIQLKVGKHPNP